MPLQLPLALKTFRVGSLTCACRLFSHHLFFVVFHSDALAWFCYSSSEACECMHAFYSGLQAPLAIKTSMCLYVLSCVRLFVTAWTVAHQAPLSMGFSRQGYWSGLPFPPPGDLPDPGIKPTVTAAPALQLDSSPLSHQASWTFIKLFGLNCFVSLGENISFFSYLFPFPLVQLDVCSDELFSWINSFPFLSRFAWSDHSFLDGMGTELPSGTSLPSALSSKHDLCTHEYCNLKTEKTLIQQRFTWHLSCAWLCAHLGEMLQWWHLTTLPIENWHCIGGGES